MGTIYGAASELRLVGGSRKCDIRRGRAATRLRHRRTGNEPGVAISRIAALRVSPTLNAVGSGHTRSLRMLNVMKE